MQAKLVLQRPQIVLLEISASQGNPTLSVEAENLAREIAGEGTSPEILNLARRVAEPQIELMRIRQARYDLLSHYLNNSEYRPDQLQRRLDASLKFCASQMRREGPGALVPRDNDSAGIPQTAPLFSISLDAKRNSAEQCLTEQYDRKKKYYVICHASSGTPCSRRQNALEAVCSCKKKNYLLRAPPASLANT